MLTTWTTNCAVLLSLDTFRQKTAKNSLAFDAGDRWFWPPGKGLQLLAAVKNYVFLLILGSGGVVSGSAGLALL
jgi:hypothetical protein